MRLKPNDSPDMEVGETRNFRFPLAAALGSNEIDGDPTVTTSGNLTSGTVTVSGTTVTVPVTADSTGTGWVKFTAALSSDEDVIGVVRVKVVDNTCGTGGRDYG